MDNILFKQTGIAPLELLSIVLLHYLKGEGSMQTSSSDRRQRSVLERVPRGVNPLYL